MSLTMQPTAATASLSSSRVQPNRFAHSRCVYSSLMFTRMCVGVYSSAWGRVSSLGWPSMSSGERVRYRSTDFPGMHRDGLVCDGPECEVCTTGAARRPNGPDASPRETSSVALVPAQSLPARTPQRDDRVHATAMPSERAGVAVGRRVVGRVDRRLPAAAWILREAADALVAAWRRHADIAATLQKARCLGDGKVLVQLDIELAVIEDQGALQRLRREAKGRAS